MKNGLPQGTYSVSHPYPAKSAIGKQMPCANNYATYYRLVSVVKEERFFGNVNSQYSIGSLWHDEIVMTPAW
jgi:hypothetical protein